MSESKIVEAARAVLRHEDEQCGALDDCSASSHHEALRDALAALAALDAERVADGWRLPKSVARKGLEDRRGPPSFILDVREPYDFCHVVERPDGTWNWEYFDRVNVIRGTAPDLESAKRAAEAAAGVKRG